MRIISEHSPQFSGGGYHFGSVWPLFTAGGRGEYRYHRSFLLTRISERTLCWASMLAWARHGSALGFLLPIVATSSPHQIWSAAMWSANAARHVRVRADATKGISLSNRTHRRLDFLRIRNVQVGSARLDLHYSKDAEGIRLEVKVTGDASRVIDFQPAVSLRAKVLGVEFNGQPCRFVSFEWDRPTRANQDDGCRRIELT